MKGYVIAIVSALFIPIVLASTCFDGFCQNGGTCSVFQGKANCSCPSNFTGDKCQKDVDECQVNSQCKNGATCSNTFGGYICSCIFGWKGPDCSINKDDCVPTGNTPLCFNGGTCVDRVGKFDCICPPGKVGPVCQHDDECFYKPCYGDAICSIDAFGQYSCKCPRGWTGENCSIDIDECNRDIMSPCHHGGTCKNTLGSFACICAPGYTGQQVCVKLVVDTSSASTLLLLSALVSLPTSTPTRISPKPSVVASISLKPELPTRATTTISTASKSLTPEISTRTTTTTSIDKDEETSEFPFQFIWGSVGAFAVLVCVVLIAIAIKQIRRKRKDPLVMERNNEDNVSMMEITPDIMNQLRDHSQQIPIEAPAEVPNSL